MTLDDILKRYSISIPKEKYTLEFFLENSEYKVYHIDFLPKTVECKKYDDVNVYYEEARHDSVLKKRYMYIEKRFVNVMIKLWLYGDVFVNIDDVYVPDRKIKKYIEKRHTKYVSLAVEKDTFDDFTEVKKIEEMDFYSILSTRDIANVIYYFEQLKLLVFTNWSCFTAVFLQEDSLELIKCIVASEGLFLRARGIDA